MNLRDLNFTVTVLIAAIFAGCSETGVASKVDAHTDHAAEHDHEAVNETPISESDHAIIDSEHAHGSTENEGVAIRSVEAHSHGDAELAVVLENGDVTIELDSPIYNILGFEHAPETEAQKAATQQAQLQLKNGDALFTFNAQAKCTALPINSDVILFDAVTLEGPHDDHEANTHDTSTHSDVILTYEFVCQDPRLLETVNINLFEFFDELSEIEANYLGPSVQRQVTLTRNNLQMDITQ